VASILEHDLDATIQHWMELVEHDEELTCIPLSFEDRTGHLPNLIADLVNRLRFLPTRESQHLQWLGSLPLLGMRVSGIARG